MIWLITVARHGRLSRSYPTILPLQTLCLVNSNQVAHHLLVNGQRTMPTKPKCPALPTVEGNPSLVSAFSEEEYRKGISALKINKAAGIDDILVEQLKNLGPKAHKWLHTMLNTWFIENKIPKIWKHSKIIAILKPGKDCDSEELDNIPPVPHLQAI